MIADELREFAETPGRFAPIPEGSSVTRFDDGRVCVIQGKTWASVSGVKVEADEVARLLADVRKLVAAEKECDWWFGPSSRPVDVAERLRELGLGPPRDQVGLAHALALTRAPTPPDTAIEVRMIDSLDDFTTAREVRWEAFDVPEDLRERQRPHLRDDFDESQRYQVPIDFLATLDGRPAATASAIPSPRGVLLIGGSTAAWARGRGLYRALVHARWRFAVERGTPVLVVHANPDTSYPILKRLGFDDVCTIERLEDPR